MLNKTPKDANGLGNLIFQLSQLPGMGERSAERMAFHILKMPDEARQALLASINSVKNIKFCSKCFNLTGAPMPSDAERSAREHRSAASNGLCDICSDNSRDRTVICVVEQSEDLWKIEKTGAYKGLYHILQGVISPLDNKGPEDVTLRQLIQRVRSDKPKEIILSTNPTVEGDNTALYIQRELKSLPVKVTRLGRGIPSGSNIEYLNKAVLIDALRERKEQVYDA
ncbi:MAG: recombination protein RecR [Planctomycetes bacterium]|nr:recombination protein RecR [Planctomycetota bacterium]